jgi:hypothetical protein
MSKVVLTHAEKQMSVFHSSTKLSHQTNPSNEAAPQTEDLKTEDRRQKTGKLDLLSSPWVGIHSVSRKEAQKPQKMNTFRLIAYLAHFCG